MKVNINSIEIFLRDLNEEAKELYMKVHGLEPDDNRHDDDLIVKTNYVKELVCPYDD